MDFQIYKDFYSHWGKKIMREAKEWEEVLFLMMVINPGCCLLLSLDFMLFCQVLNSIKRQIYTECQVI
jgi:hypothetical protein